jgi:REP element-mobilizing transposase RayT
VATVGRTSSSPTRTASTFYGLIEEGVDRFGHRIHGFCLMGNHVHLVVQVAETPLAKVVQNLSFRYTRWIHRQQRKVGYLFQGRYKAIQVDADVYLLGLVRYVHLNPVRATAILDRLLHHSHVLNIKGRSYRLRDLEQAVSLRQ